MILPFDYIGYKHLSENKRFRNHRWYSDATWWEMGECCPLLYLSGNHLSPLMIYKNKMVTLKNLILKYIGMKNILKRKCHVGINVVFIEVIETVWCMIHEKHVHYPMIMFAPFAQPVWRTKSYNFKRKAWEGNVLFFLKYFLIFFLLFGWSYLSLAYDILPTPLFRRESRRKNFF
jgi:hypothetical protein